MNNLLYNIKIDTNLITNYENIHNIMFILNNKQKRKETFETVATTKSHLKSYYKKFKIYKDITSLIDNSKKILDSLNINNYSDKIYYLELQRANILEPNKSLATAKFSFHYDDCGALRYPVWTIIYYLRKDKGIKGGNFIYVCNKTDTNKTVKLKEGSVLVFPGNLYHKPERMYGFGCRDIIVIQFKRT